MRNYYKKLLPVLLVFWGFSVLQAQNNGAWKAGGEDRGQEKAIVKGKLVDEASQSPLEYATITLFSKEDSTMVTGGVTNTEGEFEVEIAPGIYFAKIEFISYQALFISDITLDKEHMIVDLGVIEMTSNAAMLDVVEVRADKSQMQISLDKRVFNVGKDLANRGGTADDLLDNIPSVAVDIDGNVSLRGNENVKILVDGKPSGLIGVGNNNGLRQFPANMIDRVEIITNPSARYEAEGVAGIINIILRKDNTNGFNGSFDATLGYPNTYGGAVNMNYRRKKLNLFGSYGLNYRERNGSGGYYQEFYKSDTTFILDQNRIHNRSGLSNSFRFGADYFINPKNTLTAALTYKISDEANFATIEYRDYINNYPINFQGVTYRTDDEKEDESSLGYNLNYKKTFDKEDHTLVVDMQYADDIETERNQYLEEFYGSDNLPTGEPDLQQRAINEEKNKEWLVQLDYVRPVSKDGKFEAGLRSSIRKINNNYVVEEFDDVEWDTLKGLTNNFDYDENIFAGYSSFGNKYGKFSFLAGLRGEFSDVSTKLLLTDSVNRQDYFNLFPSLHVTYELPQQNAIQVSYSRRISRPRYRDLTPFRSYTDSRNQYRGNPDLKPEYTNSIEIGHIKYWDKGTISSSFYYRHTEGVVQRIRTIDKDGNTVTLPKNLATEDAFGLEFTYAYSVLEWWRLDGDLNFFRAIVDGTNLGESFKSDNYSWFGRLTSRMTVLKGTDIQLRFNYRAPTKTTQGSNEAIYFLDLGVSKDILKNKGTITLSVRDLFNTRKRRYTSYGDDFYTQGEFQWSSREIKLTLNYRLNQKKKKGGGGGFEGGGEDGGF